MSGRNAVQKLPSSSSPNLFLTSPTEDEPEVIWGMNFAEWGDSLTLIQYLEESDYLKEVPLAKDGGMTWWILTDRTVTSPVLSDKSWGYPSAMSRWWRNGTRKHGSTASRKTLNDDFTRHWPYDVAHLPRPDKCTLYVVVLPKVLLNLPGPILLFISHAIVRANVKVTHNSVQSTLERQFCLFAWYQPEIIFLPMISILVSYSCHPSNPTVSSRSTGSLRDRGALTPLLLIWFTFSAFLTCAAITMYGLLKHHRAKQLPSLSYEKWPRSKKWKEAEFLPFCPVPSEVHADRFTLVKKTSELRHMASDSNEDSFTYGLILKQPISSLEPFTDSNCIHIRYVGAMQGYPLSFSFIANIRIEFSKTSETATRRWW